MRRVTIKDIAQKAGVSPTTVSRALNDAPEISEETRRRILSICRETGYRTNLLARSLISNRTHLIGVILSDLANPFHATLAREIETYAQEKDYQVMLCNGRPSDNSIEDLFSFLISQQVDGILLTSASMSAQELVWRFQKTTPIVLIGGCVSDDPERRINAVSTDNLAGGQMAAEYLYRLGHRNVLYFGLRSTSATQTLRHAGFTAAAARLGMQVMTIENRGSTSSIQTGYQLARSFFSQPFSQTAAFAATDLVALGVMQAADELGIGIPQRLSVIGFDNLDYAALPKIRLTTMDQRKPRLARCSVDLLLELIGDYKQDEFTHRLITPQLMERSSCRAL